ncbi:MAG: hypothetical protein F6K09_34110 [Merismopedia sp. SIO2A8]|nr:hypothetical protein [Merismopedia sp. SIO2A8]
MTNWLYGKVTFGQRDISQLDYSREVVAQALEKYEQKQREQEQQRGPSTFTPSNSGQGGLELKRLQGQVRVLQGMLVLTGLALGGAVWMLYDTRPAEWSQHGTSSSNAVIVEGCVDVNLPSIPHQTTLVCR